MEDRNILVCLDFMTKSETTYLTSIDDKGFPTTRAMLNHRNKNQFPKLVDFFKDKNLDVYFTTNTFSVKVNQLQNNNKANAYFCLPSSWYGLMVQGEIEVIDNLKRDFS